MEAGGGGVAAVVEGDRALGQPGRERGAVGGVVDQAARLEVVEEVGHGRHRPRRAPVRSSGNAGRENGTAPCRTPRRRALRTVARSPRPSCLAASGAPTRPVTPCRRRRSRRESSTLYAADGTLIHTFHAEENRRSVALGPDPRHAARRRDRHRGRALLPAQRRRRPGHPAGRPRQRRGRARSAEGGSTITQQYVKQVLLDDDSRTVERKLQEASLASARAPLHQGPHPRAVPQRHLLRERRLRGRPRPPSSTSARPSASSPSPRAPCWPGSSSGRRHRPLRRPGRGHRRRRNIVLDRMVDNDFVAEADAAGRQGRPGDPGVGHRAGRRALRGRVLRRGGEAVDPRRPALRRHRPGAARPALRRRPADPDHGRPRGTGERRGGGERDPARPEHDPDVALVSIEPATGYVRAMVGGRDFFGTGEQRPSSTWPRRAATGRARRSSRSCWPPR